MDLTLPINPYLLLSLLFLATTLYLLLQPHPTTGLARWLQRKNYQYEVTTSLYMLTPTEKFVFNSVLFLTLSLLAIATFLYLPAHVKTMSSRAYYYFAGEARTSGAGSMGAGVGGGVGVDMGMGSGGSHVGEGMMR